MTARTLVCSSNSRGHIFLHIFHICFLIFLYIFHIFLRIPSHFLHIFFIFSIYSFIFAEYFCIFPHIILVFPYSVQSTGGRGVSRRFPIVVRGLRNFPEHPVINDIFLIFLQISTHFFTLRDIFLLILTKNTNQMAPIEKNSSIWPLTWFILTTNFSNFDEKFWIVFARFCLCHVRVRIIFVCASFHLSNLWRGKGCGYGIPSISNWRRKWAE